MFGLQIDKSMKLSITQQLTSQLRNQILEGRLKGGQRLPSSRSLAKELNVARNIIIEVYEQLIAEGYLKGSVGSGTYVIELLSQVSNNASGLNSPSANSVPLKDTPKDIIDFNSGNPDSSQFPRVQWAKAMKEACLEADYSSLEYGNCAGELKLRSILTEYLFRTKNIKCLPEHIIIVPGAFQGINLIAGVLKEGQNTGAVLEDPSISFVKSILQRNGVRIYPVPADSYGMQTSLLPDAGIRLIYVVPSHQFPLGSVLPVSRRLELLEYARKKEAYIIEDDYDSEYRYRGEPIQSLRHLAPERVIYLGTFSKIFSPGLRLAYLIVPPELKEKLLTSMEQINLRTPFPEQLAMARFIESNQLYRHIYKMKRIYEEKRKHLVKCLLAAFGNKINIKGDNAGLHLLAEIEGCSFKQEDLILFSESGVEADFAEDYAIIKGKHTNKLVLGYGNLDPKQIDEGVHRLQKVIRILCPHYSA